MSGDLVPGTVRPKVKPIFAKGRYLREAKRNWRVTLPSLRHRVVMMEVLQAPQLGFSPGFSILGKEVLHVYIGKCSVLGQAMLSNGRMVITCENIGLGNESFWS